MRDGPPYAIAVSSGSSASLADHFAMGLHDPPGDLVDARFDADGGLLEYLAPDVDAGTPIQGRLDLNGDGLLDGGEASLAAVGSAAGIIGWGRWTGGAARVGASSATRSPRRATSSAARRPSARADARPAPPGDPRLRQSGRSTWRPSASAPPRSLRVCRRKHAAGLGGAGRHGSAARGCRAPTLPPETVRVKRYRFR